MNYIRSKNFDTSRFLPDSHPSWRSPPKHLISKQSFLRVYSRNTPWLWQFLSEKKTKKDSSSTAVTTSYDFLFHYACTNSPQNQDQPQFGKVVFSSFCLHTPFAQARFLVGSLVNLNLDLCPKKPWENWNEPRCGQTPDSSQPLPSA